MILAQLAREVGHAAYVEIAEPVVMQLIGWVEDDGTLGMAMQLVGMLENGGVLSRLRRAVRDRIFTLMVRVAFEVDEQHLLDLLDTPSTTIDEIFDRTQQLLTDTGGTIISRVLGPDSSLSAYASECCLPRNLQRRRRELVCAVVDGFCAQVAAHDEEAPDSLGRVTSLAALRQLLSSPHQPQWALRHGLGQLRHNVSEQSLKGIYQSLGIAYVPRFSGGTFWAPSATDIYLAAPPPCYTAAIKPLEPLPTSCRISFLRARSAGVAARSSSALNRPATCVMPDMSPCSTQSSPRRRRATPT